MTKLLPALALAAAGHFPAGAAIVRAPLDFIDGTPAVALSLDGRQTTFIIDTGASLPLYLPKSVAASVARLKPDAARRTFDLRGVVQESAGFTIDGFGLSGIDFGAVSGAYLAPSGLSVSGPAKFNDRFPVLGLAIFQHKAVLLDFSGKQFVLADSVDEILPPGRTGWRRLPVELTRQGLMAAFQGGRKRYRMALDTAGNMSVVRDRAVPQDEETGTCQMQINGQDGCRYIEVAAGGVESITPILIALPDGFQADGVAGRDFFDKIRLVYDGATGQVYLQDAAGLPHAP